MKPESIKNYENPIGCSAGVRGRPGCAVRWVRARDRWSTADGADGRRRTGPMVDGGTASDGPPLLLVEPPDALLRTGKSVELTGWRRQAEVSATHVPEDFRCACSVICGAPRPVA
ncbi:hypothetical protein Misp05_15880 [Micromonospora sp. NBRC 107095]|nr:hypothetical protein Misp05_15880 [Micromonospora sp. NBRC 107095]